MNIQEAQKLSVEARAGEGEWPSQPAVPKCTEKEGDQGLADGVKAMPPKPTAITINRGRVSYMPISFRRQAAE